MITPAMYAKMIVIAKNGIMDIIDASKAVACSEASGFRVKNTVPTTSTMAAYPKYLLYIVWPENPYTGKL